MHAATSKVENSAQGSSCQLKFVHAASYKWIYVKKSVSVSPRRLRLWIGFSLSSQTVFKMHCRPLTPIRFKAPSTFLKKKKKIGAYGAFTRATKRVRFSSHVRDCDFEYLRGATVAVSMKHWLTASKVKRTSIRLNTSKVGVHGPSFFMKSL
jgi:hypothetical protein